MLALDEVASAERGARYDGGDVKHRRPLLLLAAPFVATLLLSRAWASALGDSVAAELVPLARALTPAPDAGFIGPPEPPIEATPLPTAGDAGARDAAKAPRSSHEPADGGAGDAGTSADAPTEALYVPARVVRAAIQRGSVIGEPAPGGVRLRGVSGLGAGLVDGDVVTHVMGSKVATPEAIADVVTPAVLGGERHVTGIVRRGDRVIAVTIEIPR